jgi:DNA modification methylase
MIIQGDVRTALAQLEDGSVNCVVTSPPYWGLRDYGHDGQIGLEQSPDAYVEEMVTVFREVRRVLANDGTLWLNIGDSYASGKQLVGIPWRVAFALQSDGWWLRQDIIWHKPNPMPESVTDRCTKSHEYLFLLTKSARYHFDHEAIKEESVGKWNSAKGFNKAGQSLRNIEGRIGNREDKEQEKRNRRSVWSITVKPFKGAHFAVMPEALVEPCILAGSLEGGVVLDPFFGSGTVGVVAQRLGRQWIGCELNPEYVKIAEQRTAQITPRMI